MNTKPNQVEKKSLLSRFFKKFLIFYIVMVGLLIASVFLLSLLLFNQYNNFKESFSHIDKELKTLQTTSETEILSENKTNLPYVFYPLVGDFEPSKINRNFNKISQESSKDKKHSANIESIHQNHLNDWNDLISSHPLDLVKDQIKTLRTEELDLKMSDLNRYLEIYKIEKLISESNLTSEQETIFYYLINLKHIYIKEMTLRKIEQSRKRIEAAKKEVS